MKQQWSKSSMALHWGSAALIVALAVAGLVMTDLAADSSERLLLSRLHTVFGLALMIGTVLRLVVRWRGAAPEPLPLPPLHRRGIAMVHGLLYAVLFGLGASGVATGARSTWPNYIRGELAQAPALELLASRQVHEALVFTLATLMVLHVGGVFVQQMRAGGALRRMLPMADRALSARETPQPENR